MRTLVIGDIHGCAVALRTLIESVELQGGDTIITLGDYVDRGSDSKGVVQYLIELAQSYNLISLKGNHEQIMELASSSRFDRVMWNQVGGLTTMLSYDIESLDDLPLKHVQFFNNCKLYHETDTHIFVHGGLKPDLNLEDQSEEDLLWIRMDELEAHHSGKIVICGHTPQMDHQILDIGHAICIDTHAYCDGWLTCLEVETGRCWQANEWGEKRESCLEASEL